MDFILLLFIVTGGWSLGEENAPEIQIYGSVTRILGVNGSIWSVQPGRAVNLTCKHYTEYVEWVYPQVMDALSPKEFPLHSQSVGLEGELLHYKNIRPQNSGLHLCHLRNNVNIYSEVYINVTDDISWRRGYMAMPGVGSYKLYNAAKSWSKAQRHCLAQGSHLAVPDSQLLKAFGRMSKIPLTIWVGLQRTGEWKTADGSLINATNIAQWNLTNEDGSGSCVSWLSGQFVRSPCNNTKHFICQQVAAGNGTCLSDYIDLVGVGCTQIANTCMTWKEAQQYCEASGGRMVVPSSALEKNLFQDNEDELDLWVGIHRIKEEWTTMSGQPYTTLDILKSKPEEAGDREECIVFNSTDHRLQPCSDEYQYICQQDQDWIATKVVTPRTTVEGSAITKILGTNGTEWGVAPGRRVALTCEPEYGSVQWEYPQGILKPIVQPHLWDDAEGKRLIYESITTNNTGVHRCYLKENPLISSTIYLHVSLNYTNMQHTNLLPDYGWYKISGSHLSWERAREYCESQSTHLWVPSSQQELTEIQEIDNFGEDYYLWVGISMTYEWTTVSGELLVNLLSKNWTLNMSEWDEDCLTLNSEGFQSNLCDYKAAVVCEWNAVNFTCQPGYIRFDDVCYKTNDTYVTWNEAQCFCKAQGGRLAVPTSQEQLEVLLDMADPLSTWPWLGIYKNATGSWSTVKGQQEWSFNMPYWPPENLNDSGNCIAFHQNRLTKKSCSTKYMFICKQNQGTAIATMLPRIEKENHILTMILGTNGKDWGVQPGKRVTLTCKSEHELVKWSYPKVQQEFQPKETRKFWDNEEGITLTYTSVHINNTGIHRCFTTRNSTNKADINLLVSEKYVTKRQYKLLPNVGSYKLVNEDMEWSTAKTHCEAENGHLMVPTSPKEWAALREMASNTDVWLGVRRTGEWTAVTDNNHVSDDFVDWNSGKAEGNGGCVTLSEFVLQDASCTLQHPFFCKYTSTNSTCPLRYIPVSLSDCVQLNKTELTWQRARQWCESLGLSLAVPNSQQMKDLLQNLIKSGAITAWVGIHRLHEKWTAYDGAQSTFSGVKWISTNVDEGGDCIFFREKKLLTTDCTSLKHFICQIKDVEQELHVPLQWWAILSITVLSVAAFILISVSIVLGYRLDRQRALRQTLLLGNGGEQPLESFLVDQMHQLPFNKKWEFPANHLQLGDLLGAGEFDVVRQAKACFIIPGQTVSTVAVKTVNRGADMSCLKALVLEMKILSHLGQHLNIVNFLGACTKGLGKGKLHIIVEYCPYGNLKNYLVNHRNSFVDQLELRRKTVHLTPDSHTVTSSGPKASEINKQCIAELEDFGIESSQTLWMAGTSLDAGVLTTRDLMSWSYQVAKGMDYLTSRKVIHGDLAARNVLLADNNIVKICDFGLARNLTYSCYYKKKEDDLLPVKWMSPEALSDHKFSPQSDVWAFGVLLWEFFSLGASPYPGIPLPNLFEQLQGGHRLKQPILAPIDIYHVMVRCWDADPQQRPVFSILTHELGDCLEEGVIEGYLKFHKSHFKRNQSNTEPNYMKELLDSTMNVPPSTSAHAEPSRGLIPPVPVQESRI